MDLTGVAVTAESNFPPHNVQNYTVKSCFPPRINGLGTLAKRLLTLKMRAFGGAVVTEEKRDWRELW